MLSCYKYDKQHTVMSIEQYNLQKMWISNSDQIWCKPCSSLSVDNLQSHTSGLRLHDELRIEGFAFWYISVRQGC